MSKKQTLRQPHYSPVKFLLEEKAKTSSPKGKFVPFQQERDSIGRLISHQKNQVNKVSQFRKNSKDSQVQKLVHTLTPSTCISLGQKVDLMQEQIIKSFEFNYPKQIKVGQGNKVKIRKNSCPFDLKQTYGIFSKFRNPQINLNKQSKQNCAEQNNKNHEQLGYLKMQKSSSLASLPHITAKKQSEFSKLCKKHTNDDSLIIKNSKQHHKVETNKQTPSKLSQFLPGVNPLTAKIESLESYKRWPQLNDNIEKNNQLFETKVWISKKISYGMQKTLRQLEQNM